MVAKQLTRRSNMLPPSAIWSQVITTAGAMLPHMYTAKLNTTCASTQPVNELKSVVEQSRSELSHNNGSQLERSKLSHTMDHSSCNRSFLTTKDHSNSNQSLPWCESRRRCTAIRTKYLTIDLNRKVGGGVWRRPLLPD